MSKEKHFHVTDAGRVEADTSVAIYKDRSPLVDYKALCAELQKDRDMWEERAMDQVDIENTARLSMKIAELQTKIEAAEREGPWERVDHRVEVAK